MPPPAPVIPWDEYEKKYGSLQKKAGHKKKKVNGVTVVVLPVDPSAPWSLQRVYASAVEKSEKVHEDDADDAGVDSGDEVDDKFQDLVGLREGAFEGASSGLNMQEFLALAAKEEAAKAGAARNRREGVGGRHRSVEADVFFVGGSTNPACEEA